MSNGRTRVVERLRHAILDGDWEPGERLQPMRLAKRFETSTTVVREALALLTGDGLVLTRPNHGFFVPELNLRELRDITELRCVAEALAADLAAKRGDLQWEVDLTAAHYRLARTPRRLTVDPDHINPEWSAVHREFHRVLLVACDCEPIVRLVSNLADSTELYRTWAAPSTAAAERNVEDEHAEILEAAISHNGSRLGKLLRAHYESTIRVVLDSGLLSQAAGNPEVIALGERAHPRPSSN